MNDRVDLALALDLPGAHLGQRSLPPDVARGLLGAGSTPGPVGPRGGGGRGRASRRLLDYLLVGTIFPPPPIPRGSGGDRIGSGRYGR